MIINIKNLDFSYKKNHLVLNKINLNIDENQIHAFLGHNGAGKTTLFLLLSGYLKPRSGTIHFDGHWIHSRKEISFVPETGGFFGSLTVFENLRFRFLLSDLPETQMQERVSYLCDVFDLQDHKNKVANHLSHGLKKRLALACSIVQKSKLLLLDEPTTGVDPVTHEVLKDIVLTLKKKGTTIIISSHDLSFMEDIADTITILDHGTILLSEAMDKLHDLNRLKLSDIYRNRLQEESEISYEDL